MLSKLVSFCREYDLVHKGDQITCAVSGGADSMALLWAMYLLKDSWDLRLSAAHFNHGLRGEESDEDARFVAEFCDRFSIALYMEKGQVSAGPKGLEAAARDARYAFFDTLPGKIATAHTANDNAETLLMHMVRGTGLKGLGGIAPQREKFIRPMLTLTREEVICFLQEYHVSFRTDSSNLEDDYLRNRLRHHVMPLLQKENPRFALNSSQMALRLRCDEAVLSQLTQCTNSISTLREMPAALRSRALGALLEELGVREPSSEHIALAESLVLTDNPSAQADFPGGIVVARNYDSLDRKSTPKALQSVPLPCPGEVTAGNVRIQCRPATQRAFQTDCFTVCPEGQVVVRCRLPGDVIRLSGGTKKLKELFIDRKIPAAMRVQIPVIADDRGVLGIFGIGANLDRVSDCGIEIRFINI